MNKHLKFYLLFIFIIFIFDLFCEINIPTSTQYAFPNQPTLITINNFPNIVVANESENSLSIIKLNQFKPSFKYSVKTINNSFSGPISVSYSPDNNYIAVVNYVTANVSIIYTSTFTVSGKPIPVGFEPQSVSWTTNSRYIAVANFGSSTVSIIENSNGTFKVYGQPITVGTEPSSVAWSPNGGYIAVANSNSNTVSIINSIVFTVPSNHIINVGSEPKSVTWSPDNVYIAVANYSSNTISIIEKTTSDTEPFKLKKTIKNSSSMTYFSEPQSVAWSPDGQYIAVANSGPISSTNYNGTVSIIDINNFENPSIHVVPVELEALSVSWSSNSKYIAVANNGSNTVSIIENTKSRDKPFKLISNVAVGTGPSSVAWSPQLSIASYVEITGPDRYYQKADLVEGSNSITTNKITSSGEYTFTFYNTEGTQVSSAVVNIGIFSIEANACVQYKKEGTFKIKNIPSNVASITLTNENGYSQTENITVPSSGLPEYEFKTEPLQYFGQYEFSFYDSNGNFLYSTTVDVSILQVSYLTYGAIDESAGSPGTQLNICYNTSPTAEIIYVYDNGLSLPTTQYYNIDWYYNGNLVSNVYTTLENASYTFPKITESGSYWYALVTPKGYNCTLSTPKIYFTVKDKDFSVSLSSDKTEVSYGTEVTLKANVTSGQPDYTYEFSGPNGFISSVSFVSQKTDSLTVTLTESGYYQVKVTDSYGCQVSDKLYINVCPKIDVSLSASKNLICPISSAILQAEITGGVPYYNYQFIGPNNFNYTVKDTDKLKETIEINTRNSSGYYQAIVKDSNGCVAQSNQVYIDIDKLSASLTPKYQYVNYGSNDILYLNILNGNPPYKISIAGPNFNYSKTTSNNNLEIPVENITQSGNYTYTVIDENGCYYKSSTSIILNLSVSIGPATQSIAKNSTLLLKALVKGGVGPYKYVWTKPDGSTVKTISNIFYKQNSQPIDSGTYFVTVVDSTGQSVTSNSVLVFVN